MEVVRSVKRLMYGTQQGEVESDLIKNEREMLDKQSSRRSRLFMGGGDGKHSLVLVSALGTKHVFTSPLFIIHSNKFYHYFITLLSCNYNFLEEFFKNSYGVGCVLISSKILIYENKLLGKLFFVRFTTWKSSEKVF